MQNDRMCLSQGISIRRENVGVFNRDYEVIGCNIKSISNQKYYVSNLYKNQEQSSHEQKLIESGCRVGGKIH